LCPPVFVYDEDKAVKILVEENGWRADKARKELQANAKQHGISPVFLTPFDDSDQLAKLVIEYDDSSPDDNPLSEDCPFELVRFDRPISKELLAEKIKGRKTFELSVYIHGGECWSRKGNGMQCRFDTVNCAGVLLIPEEYESLEEKEIEIIVDSALNEYNDWVNGSVFCYLVKNKDGNVIDSCGGFIGSKNISEVVKDEFPELFNEDGTIKDPEKIEDEYGIL
jgi:hypothetical protein